MRVILWRTVCEQHITTPCRDINGFGYLQFFKCQNLLISQWWSMSNKIISSVSPYTAEIYIVNRNIKYIIKYGHPTYIETFKDCIRMNQISKHFYKFFTLSPTWLCIFVWCVNGKEMLYRVMLAQLRIEILSSIIAYFCQSNTSVWLSNFY